MDLSGVSFLDVTAIDRVVRLARRLGPERTVEVVDPPRQLGTVPATLGWEQDLQVKSGRTTT